MTVTSLSLPTDLRGLVDAVARRTGAWVIVEQFGEVVAHGAGALAAAPPVVDTILTKQIAPMRRGVAWQPRAVPLRGAVDGSTAVAHDLGAGATAWFVDGEPDTRMLAALAAAVEGPEPEGDPGIADLLHPRGLRRSPVPSATLLVVRSVAPPGHLWQHVRRLATSRGWRVHFEPGLLLVAAPVGEDARSFVDDLRTHVTDAAVGRADVESGATDWAVAARLAGTAADVALALGIDLADPRAARVAAELVVREARRSARDMVALLPVAPLDVLRENDARTGSDNVGTLTAWCLAGFDVPTAAAALHLHPNTVRYRLRRLQETAHIDLSSPQQRLALQLLVG